MKKQFIAMAVLMSVMCGVAHADAKQLAEAKKQCSAAGDHAKAMGKLRDSGAMKEELMASGSQSDPGYWNRLALIRLVFVDEAHVSPDGLWSEWYSSCMKKYDSKTGERLTK